MSASSDVKAVHEAWLLMNRVFRYLGLVKAPLEARYIVNKLAGELFEDMFKEEVCRA